MTDRLLPLLVRLAAGDTDPARIAQVRAGLAAGPMASAMALDALFVDDVAGDAAALIDMLSPPGGLLGEAIAREAGEPASLGEQFAPGLPIGDALRAEAGTVEVAAGVLVAVGATPVDALPDGWISALLDRALPNELHLLAAERVMKEPALRHTLRQMADVGREVREGITREAGPTVSLWAGVAKEIGLPDPEEVPGWDGALIREAVVATAGRVDLATKVMDAVRKDARAPELIEEEPANSVNWPAMVALAFAAAALLVLLPRLTAVVPEKAPDPSGFTAQPVAFAAADEINVDRIQYGGNATVYVETPEAADAPLILWIDDGANL
jgi:hypothetical protein